MLFCNHFANFCKALFFVLLIACLCCLKLQRLSCTEINQAIGHLKGVTTWLILLFYGNPAPAETCDLFPISNTSAFLVAYTPSTYPITVLKTNNQGRTWSKIINESRPNGFPVIAEEEE